MEQSRRSFIKTSTAAGAALGVGLAGVSKAYAANEKVRAAVIGVRGRGRSHIKGFNALENVDVVALCDVDERESAKRVAELESAGAVKPKTYVDMRELFDQKDIDVIGIATPNHWHSLAGIWAMQAGKDCYVEKPCSHNVYEGRKLVEAARTYNRICQHGTQIRSSVAVREAMDLLRDGVIGDVYMAKGLCYKWRNTIGKKPDENVPSGVNYALWLGPAPQRAFSATSIHYNWPVSYTHLTLPTTH